MTAKKIAGGLRTAMNRIARMIGLLMIGLYLLFIVESGLKIVPLLSWSDFRGIPLFLALSVAIVGLVIAWGFQAWGGLLSLAGGASILVLVYTGTGPGMTFTAAVFALPLLTAGLLHLVCSVWNTLAPQPVSAPTPQAVKSSRRVRTSTAQCRLSAQKRQAHA